MLALGLSAVTGCTSTTSGPPRTTADPSARASVQQLLDELVRAGRAGDRPAFATRTGGSPGFDPWFSSLATLPWQQVAFTVDGPVGELPPDRIAALGPDAELRAVTLTWQLTGGASPPAEHTVWLTTRRRGDMVDLIADTDLPVGTLAPSRPVWLQETVDFRSGGGRAGALRGSTAPAVPWEQFATSALEAVSRLVPSTLRSHWDGGLLLQVPSTRAAFEHCLGVASGSQSALAAAAWPMGPEAASAAVQVVVNPQAVAAARLLDVDLDPTRQALQVLLTHEATHVAVHSPGSPAPTWLVEGYADHIAYRAYPDAQAAAARELLGEVRDGRVPSGLPADRDFDSAAANLDLTYAKAWPVCRFVGATYGESRLARLYRAADEGTELSGAVRSALGVDLADLVAGWRAELRRWAVTPPW